LDGDGIDQVFGRFDNLGAFWLLADHLGSVRTVLNGGGAVQDELAYDAFGNVMPGEINSLYRGHYTYTSREADPETGLLYYRARLYNPATGRWMSQDPMGFDAGDSNLYRYVNNAPTDATDPSGRMLFADQDSATMLVKKLKTDYGIAAEAHNVGDLDGKSLWYIVAEASTFNILKQIFDSAFSHLSSLQ
jgi:RHS repeat-associated protein